MRISRRLRLWVEMIATLGAVLRVTDACSSEIDVVGRDVSQFLYQAARIRVRVVAQSADLMPFCVSCHHPCNIAAR